MTTPMVEARQTVRESEPLVDLRFTIAEGPRQILSDVSQGIQQLDPDTLELMPWSEAQP